LPSNPVTDITIVDGTAIQDLSYQIGDDQVELNVPDYTVVPENAQTLFSYSLA
jgi:hypothetical protein